MVGANAAWYPVLCAVLIAPGFAAGVSLTTSAVPLAAMLCPIDVGQAGSVTCDPCPCESPVWTRTFAGSYAVAEAFRITAAPDGGAVYLSGVVHDEPEENQSEARTRIVVVAYSSSGTLLWSREPAYAVDLIVSSDGTKVYGGGGPTYALHAVSGSSAWSDGFVDYVAQDLAITDDGETLLVAAGSDGTFALDAADGSLLWSAAARAVGVATAGSFAFFSGALGTSAVNATTGTQLWTSGTLTSAPAVSADGSTLFDVRQIRTNGGFTPSEFAVRALDASSGSLAWESSRAGYVAGPLAPTPDGTRIISAEEDLPFRAGGQFVVARSTSDGSRLWATEHPRHLSSPQGPRNDIGISNDGALAFVVGGRSTLEESAAVTAYDVLDGSMVWTGLAPQDALIPKDLAVADGRVYVVSHGDGFLRLDAFDV